MNVLASRSLKAALTRRLVLGLLLLAVVGAAIAFKVATAFADRAFDRSLFDDVQVLANQVRWVEGSTTIAVAPNALIWLLADEGDSVIFRVTDLNDRRLLTSNGDLGELPKLDVRIDEPYFRSVQVGGDRLRVAYLLRAVGPNHAIALVEIGETTRKREGVARSILAGTLWMMSAFILVAVVLVWTGVGRALKPLRDLEEDAATRSIDNMQPLDPHRAPAEVRGLIRAFNGMMQRVVEAIEAQRHFLANAAHQLKTPIAGLRLQAQLALATDPPSEGRGNLASVEQRAAHVAHLIDQLLSLTQAEAGESALPSARCDLVDLVKDVVERMLPTADARAIDIGFETSGGDMTVWANRTLIGELMTNLVDNAVRYGRQGGRVTIRLQRDGDEVLLQVQDDGPGLPEHTRDLVFKRFWRSDQGSTDGAGLGLAIVKEIATRSNATVSIASRPAVDGTQVEVVFPALDP